MTRRTFWVCLLVAGAILALPARAEHTRFWRESDYAEFEKGNPRGVAVRSDGKLTPAPQFIQFSDPNLAYLWTLRLDSRGRLYAAGGSDAKVLRFDEAGKASTIFESTELVAQALAFDSQDNLYIGTSPDGKVYRVTPDGQKTVFFEPKTKYIWGLAVGSDGTLFVATGDKGEVFAVGRDGVGKAFYKSEERHARSLAFDNKGNLLIGTDPDGLVVRVEVAHKGSNLVEAGSAFVIYETDKKEITSLLADANGIIYAAAIGEKGRVTPTFQLPVTPPAVTAPGTNPSPTPGTSMTLQVQGQAPQAPANLPFFPTLGGGAEVVRIAPDGSPEKIWNSREELVYAMAFSREGKLLLGTGNNGAIVEIEGNNLFSRIAKTASSQITGLAQGPGGAVYVATANPGKVFTLGPAYDKGGTFESDTFDAKIFSHWGRLTWWGENGARQGKVAFYVRSGNTSRPEENWSPWAGPYSKSSGETVTCPPGRFVQWKAEFLDTDAAGAPSVAWVSLAYQPKNVAPVIDDVVLQEPGVRVQGFGAPTGGPPSAAPVQLHLPQRAGGSVTIPPPGSEPKSPRGEAPPQGFEQKGFQSVLWSAHDDNEDDLVFSIYYRGEGEKNWRLLKDRIDQRFYSWDSTSMPDGAYYLKIVAADSSSNPPDQALSTERESERFEVDNTPPAIENLRAETVSGERGKVRITFAARDPQSELSRAEYSADAGSWQVVFPVGLLTDAPKESYQIQLQNLSAGEHTVAVRVTDRFENLTTAKVTFAVAPR
jgi:hypothetical protein